jgi:hypothetical protein
MTEDDLAPCAFDEYGVRFETGVPVTIRYVRGTQKAPYFGAKYGQDIEPAGRYLIHNPSPGDLPSGWEAGTVEFDSPLVIALTTDPDSGPYGSGGWKARLARHFGKKGKRLTCALRALGIDGIVTCDDGGTREIVDLRPVACAGTRRAAERGAGLDLDDSPVGKLVGGRLYVHRSAEPDLPAALRDVIDEAASCLPEPPEYDVAKLDPDGRAVSFLCYDDFEGDPHPALLSSLRVDLGSGEAALRRYDGSDNPPILHRKETMLAADHPLYEEFAALTSAEEDIGLLDRPPGNRRQWQALLRRRGLG